MKQLLQFILIVLICFSLAGCYSVYDSTSNEQEPPIQIDVSATNSSQPTPEENIEKEGTDWNNFEPLCIGTIPVGCLMVPDATPTNVSACVKAALQTDQNFYASAYDSTYIKSKMGIDGLLDIYGCTGKAIFNFDWNNTLSSIVFKFDDGGSFTPELFNTLHDEICTILGVNECWDTQYGLHKDAQNGHFYSCSWKSDSGWIADLDFECTLDCYFDDNGKPDGGKVKFERTVSVEQSNHSIKTLGKSDNISQDGLYVSGTYHAGRKPYVEGEITNNSDTAVNFIKVKISLYDSNKKVIDTTWTYAIGVEGLEPGESSKWKVYCSDAEAIKISFIE